MALRSSEKREYRYPRKSTPSCKKQPSGCWWVKMPRLIKTAQKAYSWLDDSMQPSPLAVAICESIVSGYTSITGVAISTSDHT